MKIPDEKERFECRHCSVGGYHYPIQSGQVNERPSHRTTYKLLRCENCGWLTLSIYNWICPVKGVGDVILTQTLRYPPEIVRSKPNWYIDLENEYKQILDEVYSALDNQLYTLASSGVRTALDRLIVEIIGDIGSFQAKLSKLKGNNIINQEEFDLMDSVIDAGSASVHRGYSPNQDTVNAMLEIAEHIFYELKIREKRSKNLANLAKSIKSETPKRN